MLDIISLYYTGSMYGAGQKVNRSGFLNKLR